MPAALNTMAVATASLRMMLNAFPPLGRGSSAASQKDILNARYGKSSVPYNIASTPLARNTCLLFLVATLTARARSGYSRAHGSRRWCQTNANWSLVFPSQAGMETQMSRISFKRRRFLPDVTRHAAWL